MLTTYNSSNIKAQNSTIFVYTTHDGLLQNSVTHLVFDNEDQLWIGTHGGVNIFDGQRFSEIASPEMHPRISLLLKDQNNRILIVDGIDNLYEGQSNKLIKLNLQKGEKYTSWFFNGGTNFNFTNNVDIYRYVILNILGYKNIKYFSKNQTTYYQNKISNYENNNGFFLVDSTLVNIQKNKQSVLTFTNGETHLLKNEIPLDMNENGLVFQTDQATFWIYDHTIFKLEIKNDSLIATPKLFNVPLEKKRNELICGQYNPKTGYFYFGSSKFGLFEVIPKLFNNVKHVIPNLKEYSCAYYSQAEYGDQNIFINNYLTISKTGKFTFNKPNQVYYRALNYKDKQNKLWYSDQNNIFIKDRNQNEILKFDSIHKTIHNILPYNENITYLANPDLILCLENKKLKLTVTKESLGLDKSEFINYLFKIDESNDIQVLTNSNIYQFSHETRRTKKNLSMPTADYRIMKKLEDDYYFVGTYGNGYFVYHKGQWTKMPLDKHGYLKFSHTALIDSLGFVWLSTNNGLFQASFKEIVAYIKDNSKQLFYYYYDKSSGFLTNEFNGGCQSPAIKLKNGMFSFSSMDGLVQFDPLQVTANFPHHPPHLINIWLNGSGQDSVPTSLVITQDIKDIKLEVSSTFYGHQDNLQIQYKIPGYVDQWTDLTDQRYINLQNATFGDYIIEIRQRIGFGSHDFEYISYPLVVLPYFYQTWWFIAILSVIGLSLAYIFSRWYSRYMIQKNKELEMLILERNKEVLQTNEVLQEQVKQNDLFQSIFVHDIKSPIRFITSNTALLKTHWNHLDTTIKQDQISHIHDAATKIDHFIEETLLWIKIRNGELQLETNDFQALAMIQECIDFHKESDKIIRGDIQILADVHQDLYLTQDERLLATIIRNLISNSIKYTTHGKIIVYFLSKPNGSFTIGCKDTGKGMPKSLVEKLLSDHYRGNDIRDDSFKMGYVIIKEIVRLIGGQLHIESEENHGTHVWVEI